MLDIEDFKKNLDKSLGLMGIDPGRKRVGIAISDEIKLLLLLTLQLLKINILILLKK